MRALFGAALCAGAGLFCPNHAGARPNGIVTGDCTACHGASSGAIVEVSASPAAFEPADEVTFTVTVRAEAGEAADAGIFVGFPSHGELFALSGAGLTLVEGTGLVHSQPMGAVDGVATFRFGYRAPAEPGGVTLAIAALAGNGDGRSTGDAPGHTRYLQAFGCNGITHYEDLDRDGYGAEAFDTGIGCEGVTPPVGFAIAAGDCNENSAATHPNAPELCNQKDDDCDGEIDENSTPVELFPDPDGDGYYGLDSGASVLGCVGMLGYAADGGDCLPNNPAASPGGVETCNAIDDDCDGQADEQVLPQCGIGACGNESYTCDVDDCYPGTPQPERCNRRDDDCNGVVDDGALCPEGSACLDGACVTLEGGTGGNAGASGGAGATGSGGASSGVSAQGGTGDGGGDTELAGRGGTASMAGAAGTASMAGAAARPGTAPAGCSVGPFRAHTSGAALALLWLGFFLRRAAALFARQSREKQL